MHYTVDGGAKKSNRGNGGNPIAEGHNHPYDWKGEERRWCFQSPE